MTCSHCINKDGFKRLLQLDVKDKIKVWQCRSCGQIILEKGKNNVTSK